MLYVDQMQENKLVKCLGKKLRDGLLDDKEIELDLADTTNPMGGMVDIPGQPGMGMMNIGEIFGKAMGGRTIKT